MPDEDEKDHDSSVDPVARTLGLTLVMFVSGCLIGLLVMWLIRD